MIFPWNGFEKPTCGALGVPLALEGMELTATNLRAIAQRSAAQRLICLDAKLHNRSVATTADGDEWLLDSMSSGGALRDWETQGFGFGSHPLPATSFRSGGVESGEECFKVQSAEFSGHLLISWIAPRGFAGTAVWVTSPPASPDKRRA